MGPKFKAIPWELQEALAQNQGSLFSVILSFSAYFITLSWLSKVGKDLQDHERQPIAGLHVCSDGPSQGFSEQILF